MTSSRLHQQPFFDFFFIGIGFAGIGIMCSIPSAPPLGFLLPDFRAISPPFAG
jgi:hypothetical protein